MTTSAVALNNWVNGTYNYVRSLNGTVLESGTQIALSHWETEHRPASVSSLFANKNRLSWRNPTGWHHDGSSLVVLGGKAGFLRSDGQLEMWDGGSFWGYLFWRDTQYLAASFIFPPSLIAKTETKALLKLKNQDIHLGNFLAESKEVLGMFHNTARSIAKDVTRFRKRFPNLWELVKKNQNGRQGRRSNCIPNAWLELQYGWKPLMSDIYGAASALSQKSRDVGSLFSVSATGQDDLTLDKYLVDGVRGLWFVPVRQSVTFTSKVKLWYILKNPVLAQLSSLGLVNPAEIVWEVTKYSFVVDWFLPVSDWLSALTADLGYEFKSGTRSDVTKCSVAKTGGAFTYSWNDQLFRGDTPRFSNRSYNFDRSVYSVSPVPGIYFKNPISVYHTANAMALLAQAFR